MRKICSSRKTSCRLAFNLRALARSTPNGFSMTMYERSTSWASPSRRTTGGAVDRGAQRLPAGGERNVVEEGRERLPVALGDLARRELVERGARELAERVGAHVVERDADDATAGDEAGVRQMKEAGQELAARQVAGGTDEDDELRITRTDAGRDLVGHAARITQPAGCQVTSRWRRGRMARPLQMCSRPDGCGRFPLAMAKDVVPIPGPTSVERLELLNRRGGSPGKFRIAVDRLAVEKREEDAYLVEVARAEAVRVAVEDDEVGGLAGGEGAVFPLFAGREGGVAGVGGEGGVEADARRRRLDRVERVHRRRRPVAAGEYAAARG